MVNVTPYMAAAVGQALEETSTMLAESLTLRHLAKNGVVTLEEAAFYRNLCDQVITEAAEDFIPEEVETEDPMDAIELYDAAGNCYLFDPNTGSLTPCDPVEGGEPQATEGEISDDDQAPAAPAAPVAESTVVEGSEPVEGEGTVVEESTVITQSHNSSVVAKILSNIKA